MLFNDAGNHLISGDDTDDGLFSHLTQILAAGNYPLLITHSFGGLNALDGSAASFSGTDGFNAGSYKIGGSATLSSVKTSLNGEPNPYLDSMQFSVELTNATLNPASVPEPQSVALFGLALTALALARRRQPGRK